MHRGSRRARQTHMTGPQAAPHPQPDRRDEVDRRDKMRGRAARRPARGRRSLAVARHDAEHHAGARQARASSGSDRRAAGIDRQWCSGRRPSAAGDPVAPRAVASVPMDVCAKMRHDAPRALRPHAGQRQSARRARWSGTGCRWLSSALYPAILMTAHPSATRPDIDRITGRRRLRPQPPDRLVAPAGARGERSRSTT